jgi:hypothetical protein
VVRLFLASIVLTTVAGGAEIKGIEAVLLHCWQSEDVGDLTLAVSANFTDRPFAISSAPFIAKSRGCDLPDSKRLDNLKTTVDQMRNAGIKLHVITYLGGLHDTKLAKNKDMDGTLDGNFALFWDTIVASKFSDSQVTFLVGASLEDGYANADAELPNDALKSLLNGIMKRSSEKTDEQATVRITMLLSLLQQRRFILVRCPNPDNTPSQPDFDSIVFEYSTSMLKGKTLVPVIHESHGAKPNEVIGADGKKVNIRAYKIWSNDGPLVAYDCENYGVSANSKKKESCKDCDEFGDPQTVSSFRSASASLEYRLIWRPLYNMFTRKGDSYANPGASRKSVDVLFGKDERERNVLTRFVSNKCP